MRLAVISVRASSISLWMSSPTCEVSEPKRSPNDRSLLGAAMLDGSRIRRGARRAARNRAAAGGHAVLRAAAQAGATGVPPARLVRGPAIRRATVASSVALVAAVAARGATRAGL